MTTTTNQQLRYVRGSSSLTTAIDRGSRMRKIGRRVCNCEPPQEVAVRTSKTVKNPGRMFKCCHKFKGCDFFEWVDTEIFHPNCGVGCCIHGGLSGQALMSGCCSWQPQRSPPYNYGDHHGGCPSTIFRSPCSSHHKDDSFGDKMEPPQ
ncbi:uncharacterized protein LOC115725708 [Cannabis sativa]|uniref:uncharacterized protein LOC115725708 n=1 Tax=Cannabis sativa TaxID=3483 RepID=UPI0029C9C7F7|nr:uncharacterized protein LOC115725708 [Cannabis sativa]